MNDEELMTDPDIGKSAGTSSLLDRKFWLVIVVMVAAIAAGSLLLS